MIDLIASSLILVALTLIPAQSTHIINGQVQDSAGKAACGVRVCAYAADFDPNKPNVVIPCALSDASGRFGIGVNKASKYRLFYDDSSHGHWSPYLPFFRQPSVPLPEVLLDETHPQASVTISMLPKNGLLVGKSIDAKTGLPVESVDFILCHAASSGICWRISARSADGRFRIPAPHVPLTLRIKANGFDDWLGPNGGDRETSFSVAPETSEELTVFLKRSEASAGKSISESEKQVGVNLPAPVQMSPAADAVFDYYPRRTKLAWSPVEGAVSYSVEVDYCAGGMRNRAACVNPQPLAVTSNPPTSDIVNTTYEFEFVGAQPGRWRVWAVDREGREGFKSPWRRFAYLQ